MVFYFTATGNSLYIAKQLDKNLVSIPQVLRQEQREFSDNSIGIVSPIYSHEMPPLVKEFLKHTTFHTDYFYLVLTYGSQHGGAAKLAKEFCESCGISVQYSNVILMADNWLPAFDMAVESSVEKKISEQLDTILTDLRERKKFVGAVTEKDIADHTRSLERKKQRDPGAWRHLIQVTDSCVGCGICEKVCPTSSIRVIDGKAVHFPEQCQPCFACVHACPRKAIGLTIPEKNPQARYRNSQITLKEIIESNGAKRNET